MSKALQSYFREVRGRQADLARAIDVKEGHLSSVASGRKDPSVELLRKIAQATEIPLSVLVDDPQGPTLVSIVSWISAGALVQVDAVSPESVEGQYLVCGAGRGDWIAFRVDGTSMDRISPPGSVILVNRAERQLVPNACYVFADHDGGATYKRFRPDPMRLEAVTTLPDLHPTIFPDNTPAVIGRVRRSVLEM